MPGVEPIVWLSLSQTTTLAPYWHQPTNKYKHLFLNNFKK